MFSTWHGTVSQRVHVCYLIVNAAQFDTVVIILQFLFPPQIRGRTNMIKNT